MPDVVVVIPNHHPTLEFLTEWKELKHQSVIVVQDGPDDPVLPAFDDLIVCTWADIDEELGDDAWIIPRKSGAIRSFGFWKAWQRKPRMILTLDTDCYPEADDYWVGWHRQNLGRMVTQDWVGSGGESPFVRGFPYGVRNTAPVKLSHGLWSGVPDWDAVTQMQNPDERWPRFGASASIPRWSFFPMCSMNLAWAPEITPLLYHGLHGEGWGVDRFDDIWAGVICKRVLDHLGWAATTGAPSVEHRKQSDVWANLAKEAPGMGMNEHFWRHVQAADLSKADTVESAYLAVINGLPDVIEHEPDGWTAKFKEAARIWLRLFDEKAL